MLLEEYALARCAPVRMWTIRYGITIPKDGVFTQRGRVPHLMKKLLYINTGGVFNVKYLSGKTQGRKSKGLIFPIITPGSMLNGGNIFTAHNKLWEGNVFTPVCDSVYRGVSVQGNPPPPFLILVLLDFLFSRVKASTANIGIIANFV